MGYFEESKLKRLQALLEPSTLSKEIVSSVKTAYIPDLFSIESADLNGPSKT